LAIARLALGAGQGVLALWRATTLALRFRHVTTLKHHAVAAVIGVDPTIAVALIRPERRFSRSR